ncbi:permease [Desulfocarbo indianensis]|nr:permease [Desulfocarbo indianensis]
MAWRNLWRNPRRTLLTMSAIAFACVLLVFMLSWQFGSYETMINTAVKVQTGHLHVEAADYQDRQDMRLVIKDPQAVTKMVQAAPGVEAYTVRANSFALVSSQERTYGILVVGIDPAREAKVSTLKSIVRQGSFLEPGDHEGALVGRLLAQNLQVKLGDELTVLGQGRDGSIAALVLKVRGIYSSGMDDFDRSSIQMGLQAFQDAFTMEGAAHQVVAICQSLEEVAGAKAYMAAHLPPQKDPGLTVLDWKQLMPGLLQGIEMDLVSGIIFYIILLVVVTFSILNTFLMSILERTHEFGVLMAMGAKPGRLGRLVVMESLAMNLLGVGAGMIMGALITWYFQVQGIDLGAQELMAQYGIVGRIYPRLSWLSLLSGPAVVFVMTLLAALYPTRRLWKLRPVEAMNYA